MGSEWERKRAEGFKKRLDKRLVELGTPNLFTQLSTWPVLREDLARHG
jgi:hypothetical protein